MSYRNVSAAIALSVLCWLNMSTASASEIILGIKAGGVDFDADGIDPTTIVTGQLGYEFLDLIAADIAQVQPFLSGLSSDQRKILETSWPGPETWLVPNNHVAPPWITGGRDTLAIRVTDHPVAAALCHSFGGPLVSTSANPHGFPPAKSLLKVNLYFRKQLDYIVPGLLGKSDRPTTIKHLMTGETIRS